MVASAPNHLLEATILEVTTAPAPEASGPPARREDVLSVPQTSTVRAPGVPGRLQPHAPSTPSINWLLEALHCSILDGEPNVPSLLARPHLISRFINRMAGRDNRSRLERLSWRQLQLENDVDLVRLIARKRETYFGTCAQERDLHAVALALRATSRMLQDAEEALEAERAHLSMQIELKEERRRRTEAEVAVTQMKLQEEELVAARVFAERERDMAKVEKLEAEATRSAAEEARATAKVAWELLMKHD